MPSRSIAAALFGAFALAAVVPGAARAADAGAVLAAATASPAPSGGPTDPALPTPSATPSPGPKGKGKPRPTPAQAPSAAPSAAAVSPTPAAGVPAPTASAQATFGPVKSTVPRRPSAFGFVYLRTRYARDDQGAALRKPITQLAGLQYILGVWNAHIYVPTADRKVAHDFGHTTYVFARTMRDRWILGTDAKNTEFLYFTYDPPAGHYVYMDAKGFPSYGLSYATGAPKHLQFDAVVESALGDERRLRTKLDYTDASHFSLLDEELTPNDKWTPVVEFDFVKR